MFDKRTKIICTIGPSCSSEIEIKKMFKSGMNVGRFNFSHGTHESQREMIDIFKKVRDKLNLPGAILLDTKGPEIRLGNFKNSSENLVTGAKFTLTSRDVEGTRDICSISYANMPSQVKQGDTILIDDGNINLIVDNTDGTDIKCTVVYGGIVSNHKGVNVPKVHMDMPYLSDKDKMDLRFGIDNDVDYIAASFVRSSKDVKDIRSYLDYYGGKKIKIISKIENIEGIENFDSILENCDGIMVARGDMGVEIEYERLPGIQKRFIRSCYRSGKVVITATQMLESMVHNPTPTRAEITDVANAVFDGTSAVMLSGETANGEHPSLVVQTMSKIVKQAEKDVMEMGLFSNMKYTPERDTTEAICDAACITAHDIHAKAIIAVTVSGHTAQRVSKFRPSVPIIAVTHDKKTFNQLSLFWGVFPIYDALKEDEEKLFSNAVLCAKRTGYVRSGDTVVITSGVKIDKSGHANVLKVEQIEEDYVD